MTIVGLVGGLGPESTVDYYRRILDAWQHAGGTTAPAIVIDSLDVATALQLVEHDRDGFTEYLARSVNRLAAAGADLVAMTANTAHLVFDEVAARSPVPLVSIVETCAATAHRLGLRRLALLGTRFTMQAPFYPAVFERYGLHVAVPDEDERRLLHARYVGELLKGQFLDGTRSEIVTLVERMRDRDAIDGVILGGTELPLLFRAPEVAGLPALDTTALHVDAIVDRLKHGVSTTAAGEPPESSSSSGVSVAAADRLRVIVGRATPALLALSDAASATPRAPGAWSPRQILGHLVDSASNNHRRVLFARWQDDLVFEGYEQDAWVAAQDYAHAPCPAWWNSGGR